MSHRKQELVGVVAILEGAAPEHMAIVEHGGEHEIRSVLMAKAILLLGL